MRMAYSGHELSMGHVAWRTPLIFFFCSLFLQFSFAFGPTPLWVYTDGIRLYTYPSPFSLWDRYQWVTKLFFSYNGMARVLTSFVYVLIQVPAWFFFFFHSMDVCRERERESASWDLCVCTVWYTHTQREKDSRSLSTCTSRDCRWWRRRATPNLNDPEHNKKGVGGSFWNDKKIETFEIPAFSCARLDRIINENIPIF